MRKKEKLFKALKEEFELKAKKKVAARRWSRFIDPERIAREKARMADKEKRDKEKAEAKEKHKEEVAQRKEERKAIKEDTLTLTMEMKPEIMMMLDELYHDEEKGFMNQHQLYEQAHSMNKLVTMQHVKEFFDNLDKTRAPIKDHKGMNSWVGRLPREQYQVDVGYLNKGITEDMDVDGYFLVCFDVFSKRAEAVAIDSVSQKNALEALQSCIYEMGFPREIYTDRGKEFEGVFEKWCQEEGIKKITTRGFARFGERFIRYIKMQLWKRKELEGGWERQLPIIMKIYNSTPNVHSKLTPLEAHEDENALQQKLALMMQQKQERKYPPLQVGDKVRLKVKKKAHDKEITAQWTKELYTVVFMHYESSGNIVYGLTDEDGEDVDHWFTRHEMLKV